MTKRWYIHRDGRTLGPFDARDIREALRDGTWDPFDLVSFEGSAVKVPLVEVDEIFASSSVDLVAAEASLAISMQPTPLAAEDPLAAQADAFSTSVSPLDLEMELDSQVAGIPLAGGDQQQQPERKQEKKADDQQKEKRRSSSSSRRRKKRKRDPKRFFLKDAKGRLLGPQSAGEIQSLFYKGVLDRNVKVIKEGSSQAVQVGKFVAVYSESRRKKAMQGAHPTIAGGGMSTSQLHEMHMAKNMPKAGKFDYQPMLVIGVFVLALSTAFIAGWLFLSGDNDRMSSKPSPTKTVKPRTKKRPSSSRLKRPKSFKVKKVKRSKTTKKAAPLRKKTIKRSKSLTLGIGQSKGPKPKKYSSSRRYVPTRKKSIYAKPPSKTKSTAAKPAYKPAKPTYKPSKPTYKPPPKKAASGPSVASLSSGQQVAGFGPCKYNVGTVKGCAGACSVTFAGPGGTFTGKFFGDEYKNALIAKGGTAYLSGIVTKNGSAVSIIINGVK